MNTTPLIVTLHDIDLYRTFIEGAQGLPTSACLFAQRLSDLERADVIVVDEAGQVRDTVDRKQMDDIMASIARIEMGGLRLRPRRHRRPPARVM